MNLFKRPQMIYQLGNFYVDLSKIVAIDYPRVETFHGHEQGSINIDLHFTSGKIIETRFQYERGTIKPDDAVKSVAWEYHRPLVDAWKEFKNK